MKKSDLKTGMMVVLNNNEYYLVLLGTPHGDILSRMERGWGYMGLDSYNDNLECENTAHEDPEIDLEYTVKAVYNAKDIQRLLIEGTNRELLWSRNSDKQ